MNSKYNWKQISKAQAAQFCRHARKNQPYRGYAVDLGDGRIVSNTPDHGWMLGTFKSNSELLAEHRGEFFDGVIDGMDCCGSVQ